MWYFIYGYKDWGESINGCIKSIHHLQTLESNMYEESLVLSNLNSKLFRFHCAQPNKDIYAMQYVTVVFFAPALVYE